MLVWQVNIRARVVKGSADQSHLMESLRAEIAALRSEIEHLEKYRDGHAWPYAVDSRPHAAQNGMTPSSTRLDTERSDDPHRTDENGPYGTPYRISHGACPITPYRISHGACPITPYRISHGACPITPYCISHGACPITPYRISHGRFGCRTAHCILHRAQQ